VPLNIKQLPQYVQDTIELKEQTDQTFAMNFLDKPYTEIFFDILNQRRNNPEHCIIISMSGLQGSGKCFKQNSKVLSKRGVIEGKDLVVGDIVFNECGEETKILNKWNTEKNCLKLKLDFANDVIISKEHKFPTLRGELSAEELKLGDFIQLSVPKITVSGTTSDYDRAFVFGSFIADGNIIIRRKKDVVGKKGMKKSGNAYLMQISNNDEEYLNYILKKIKKEFNFINVVVRRASGIGRYVLVATGKEEVFRFSELCGKNSDDKKVPFEIFKTIEGVRGFLDGYANNDLTCNIVKSKKNTWKTEVGFLIKSEVAAMSILDALHFEDIYPTVVIRELKSGKWKGRKYYRMTIPAKSVMKFFNKRNFVNESKLVRVNEVKNKRLENSVGKSYNTIKGNSIFTNDNKIKEIGGIKYAKILKIEDVGMQSCVDVEVDCESHLFQFAGGLVTHNSMSAITLACYLDPKFSADRIFFGYDDLVHNRQTLPDNCCVVVDEQSQTYGIDAHRIMIVLQNLKEQLRKRGISFIFCSPVIYEEAKSSMFIIETIFIDEETREVVAALKDRDGLVYGHVRIPHPLKPIDEQGGLATSELIKIYQAKKDEHLETVLGRDAKDHTLETAEAVMKHSMFVKAEQIYVKRYGYIPQGSLQQLINMIFPEYNSGVMTAEIAGRVRLIKEMSGQWDLSGHSSKSKKDDDLSLASKKKKR
jgi:hypothetical protein